MPQGWKETIHPQSLRQQVIDKIIEAIAKGWLKPGDRIVEAELAGDLGISRSPVREALSTLARDGILVAIPHRGTFVTELDREEIREVCTLRALLEAFAVRRIIGSGTRQESARQLWSRYEEMEIAASFGHANRLAELDMSLHETIVLSSGNTHLHRAWNPLRYRFLLYSILTIGKRYESFDAFLELHRRLIRLIESGDPDEAARKIADHIHRAGENLIRSIEAQPIPVKNPSTEDDPD